MKITSTSTKWCSSQNPDTNFVMYTGIWIIIIIIMINDKCWTRLTSRFLWHTPFLIVRLNFLPKEPKTTLNFCLYKFLLQDFTKIMFPFAISNKMCRKIWYRNLPIARAFLFVPKPVSHKRYSQSKLTFPYHCSYTQTMNSFQHTQQVHMHSWAG